MKLSHCLKDETFFAKKEFIPLKFSGWSSFLDYTVHMLPSSFPYLYNSQMPRIWRIKCDDSTEKTEEGRLIFLWMRRQWVRCSALQSATQKCCWLSEIKRWVAYQSDGKYDKATGQKSLGPILGPIFIRIFVWVKFVCTNIFRHSDIRVKRVWSKIFVLIFSLNWTILTYNLSFACVSPNMIVAKLISKFIDLEINGKTGF